MSTRDELAETVIAAVTRSRFDPDAVLPNDIADALIAEGWRKMPSRDDILAELDPIGVEGRHAGRIFAGRALAQKQAEAIADAILALMEVDR